MSACFKAGRNVDIELRLISYADAAHVDRVDYQLSEDSREAVATFRCESFGDCVVFLELSDEALVTESDLATMAMLANAELERIVCDSGYGAVFDIIRQSSPVTVPDRFRIEYKQFQ
ncbi:MULTISPECIES: hypothetical protein [Rhizobium]|uniref:Uncharacterized protein n=1 Tax=Rhizobium rhododendri TaxID=2506430 RepID=A0ABY8IPU5_9HYPH|nr:MULTISPECIES: hypothetical protein [Rhizobium]MBO9097624.1 hypothetical protein [Rhizobium sp. L58/93]MBO9171813.1 hypothetical protein [Rhizobium sp. L245/93]MBO9183806.1 hypothetical protein [Rhizobium sp. E27B/91]MBZ5762554.1 hypothetical protein [Rhizobium sp. VS19-DR96]MBZ5768552.1 hypothetical protein [Rhizobium sp. VS19-DR129.2]